MSEAGETPAALSAFLRGVERRAVLFAQLQSGNPDVGDMTLLAAMRAFRSHAASAPMADWPRRFWALLIASPGLRQNAAAASWPLALQRLSALEPPVRAALLARLVAGLAEDDATAVLGLDQAGYRQALTSACPQDSAGRPDPEGWRLLAEAAQQQLRDLPPDRLARLARLRESAIASVPARQPPLVPASWVPAQQPRGTRRWWWALLVLVVCGGAIAATYLWPQMFTWLPASTTASSSSETDTFGAPPIAIEALPSSAPAARYDAAFAQLSHPDFDLLFDAEGEAIAQQADFYAWYAADGPAETPAAVNATGNTLPESTNAEF
ncbi:MULTISPECIES: hypothetical protein [unclassified Pseudoxanthomonas]|uniref:hypothetical protein n=1 Tax=unclassified Pseudoxanthomonas TaxID=2645906 RepID=UPI00307859AE